MILGWEHSPFLGNAAIVLRGNSSDETYELPDGGDNIGSKVIGKIIQLLDKVQCKTNPVANKCWYFMYHEGGLNIEVEVGYIYLW